MQKINTGVYFSSLCKIIKDFMIGCPTSIQHRTTSYKIVHNFIYLYYMYINSSVTLKKHTPVHRHYIYIADFIKQMVKN